MLEHEDLDFDLPVLPGPDEPDGAAEDDADDGAALVQPAALIPDSAASRALNSVWSGEPVTIIDSPPGAGKTELCATVVAHLSQRTELKVVVATVTRDQVLGTAARLTTQMPAKRVVVAMSDVRSDAVPEGVEISKEGAQDRPHVVELRTLAGCAMKAIDCDVLVVDEAYQATFAQVTRSAAAAKQVLLIGDPGQIGPVVTVDTSAWHRRKLQPHGRAPEVFAKVGRPVRVNLTSTWRLGPRSTEAIAPLYSFPFTSSRPERSLWGLDEIEAFEVEPASSPYDPAVLSVVASHAAALTQATLVEAGGERQLDEYDVAVVVSHNAQVSGIEGFLNSMGVHGVTVGTADRLQGGQWHAVVAIDPFVGNDGTLSPHTLASGRLCVMASRHATHLSWFHDGHWNEAIDATTMSDQVAREAKLVRSRLTAA